MWIRSRDKVKLVNCNVVYLTKDDKKDFIIKGNYTDSNSGNDYHLGDYKTRERVVEIFNEIQQCLIGKYVVSIEDVNSEITYLAPPDYVYEMPNE